MGFSLLANPFAVLRATARTPVAQLPDLAAGVGDPGAAAAVRALSVPRTRLPAELSFLPGLDDADVARVLDVLAAAAPDRARLPALPPAARANVLAHLCAGGGAAAEDRRDLVDAQRPFADPALLAALDADRGAAGMPPVQPGALRGEAETLADQHAAALLAACLAVPGPAAAVTDLVAGAADGAPAAFTRKLAAAWTRSEAAALARAEEAVHAARFALLAEPGDATGDGMAAAVRAWAALSAPQRLADARAGLDHGPTLRLLGPCRKAAEVLGDKGRPALAHALAETLADAFAALPGEAAALREEADRAAGLAEDGQLEDRMRPLRVLAGQFAQDPGALRAALDRAAFGPAAPAPAGELWGAFDAAAAACTRSDAPWTLLLDLERRLGGEHEPAGGAAALSLRRGLLARAEAAGRDALADRLRAGLRGLERAAARWRFRSLQVRAKGSWSPAAGPRHVLEAAGALLALTDDPDERAALQKEVAAMRLRIRRMRVALGSVAAMVAAVLLASWADGSYAAAPPWRGVPARPLLASAAGAADLSLPAPAPPAPPIIAPGPAPAPLPVPVPVPAPAYMPKAPEPPAAAPPAFPVRASPAEQQPRADGQVRSLPEVRWCAFNDLRLDGAGAAAPPDRQPALRALQDTWRRLCLTYTARRRDEDQVKAEAARLRPRLLEEGRAMLDAPR